MRNVNKQEGSADVEVIAGIFIFALILASIAAWFTHVFTCLSEEAWGFLIAGAILFPIAIVHGFGIWFGFF